jgi:hypothetical protein
MDRLNVRNILRKKNTKVEGNNYNCVLCSQNREETIFHLFFSCPFSKACWNHLNINWNLDLNFHNMMKSGKAAVSQLLFHGVHGGSLAHLEAEKQFDFPFKCALSSVLEGWLPLGASLQAHRMSSDRQPLFLSLL